MHDLIVQDVEGAIISRHPYTGTEHWNFFFWCYFFFFWCLVARDSLSPPVHFNYNTTFRIAVIKRYSVDTKHPLFSFLEIRKGEKTVYTFHMVCACVAVLDRIELSLD